MVDVRSLPAGYGIFTYQLAIYLNQTDILPEDITRHLREATLLRRNRRVREIAEG